MERLSLSDLNENLCEIPQKFLEDTYSQLLNDMAKVGLTEYERLNDPIDLNTILNFAERLLNRLHTDEIEKLFHLIYVVDIPQNIIEHLFEEVIESDKLAKLILIREWQKVKMRKSLS